jgi:hypothetical protein
MTEKDFIPMRSQPRIVLLVLALLIAAGLLFAFLHRGQQVSRQADKALVTQAEQFDRMRQVDPALVKWREVQQIPVAQEATCLAVAPDGGLYVGAGNKLSVPGNGTGPRGARQLPFAATAVSVGKELFLASRDRVYSLNSALMEQGSLGARAVLTGIAASAKDVWVADSGNRVIWHYDTSGRLLGSFGGREGKDKSKGLIVPSPHLKVVLKPDGSLLVNNPGRLRVDTYSPAGALRSSFGKASVDITGFCGCCNPIDLALLADGRVVTAEKGLPRVKVYGSDGALESVVVGPSGLSPRCEPQIAVSPTGQVLVLDAPARVVRVFERKK